MTIKAWLKRRRELKELEKQIDKKIEKEGIDYMFKNWWDNYKNGNKS